MSWLKFPINGIIFGIIDFIAYDIILLYFYDFMEHKVSSPSPKSNILIYISPHLGIVLWINIWNQNELWKYLEKII